jgi:hypothetical protein
MTFSSLIFLVVVVVVVYRDGLMAGDAIGLDVT